MDYDKINKWYLRDYIECSLIGLFVLGAAISIHWLTLEV